MTKELPRFIRDMLSSPPKSGEGFHSWLFRMARLLHPYWSEEEIYSFLESCASNCGRFVSQKEIRDAIRNSKAIAWNPANPDNFNVKPRQWSPRNDNQIKEILTTEGTLYHLWELSPIRQDDDLSHSEEIIDRLFPVNPLLCVGVSAKEFKTLKRDELQGELSSLSLIVPSSMSKSTGITKEGNESARCLDNTGERRFLVIEFDGDTEDNQAVKLAHLAIYAPLVLACRSGGKSVHGWFYCLGQPEDKLRRFMDYAVSIGADPATWSKCQMVRMPDGLRDNGNRQSVIYFNPSVLETKNGL